MHIETLKTFCDLVETGSFNKAAQRSFISQSAVSQQLKALERRYGRPLIERGSRRGLALTDRHRDSCDGPDHAAAQYLRRRRPDHHPDLHRQHGH